MPNPLARFLIHWITLALSLWIVSEIFSGIRFADGRSLLIAALVLGFVNAIVRPVLVLLTLPLTVITLGLFLLVLNALMLMLVSSLVSGFVVASFGTAFLASIVLSIVSYVLGALLGAGVRSA
jgi:putative membrane protein